MLRTKEERAEAKRLNHEECQHMFVVRMGEMDELLAKIQQHREDHFGCSPETVSLATYVGTAGHVVEKLQEIVDHLESM